MNRLSLIALIFSAFVSNSALADDTHHPGQQKTSQNSSMPVSAARDNAAETTAAAGFVYTADELGATVSAINLASGQVTTAKITITPHNAQIVADGKSLFIVGMAIGAAHGKTDNSSPPGRFIIVKTDDFANEKPLEIIVGNHPAHVVADRDARLAYVTDGKDNVVRIVNVAERKIVGEIATGALPHGLRMSTDEREIYTANVTDGTVSVIDVGQSKEIARIAIGKAPVQVAFTPDGKRVYVSLRDENSVAVIDTQLRKKIATIKVGSKPIQLYVTPDGKYVYVANQGTEQSPGNTVSVIDTANKQVAATINVGRGAHGVVVSDDGKFVFISNIYDNSVSVIDTATQQVVKTFKVGKGPNGISYRAAN